VGRPWHTDAIQDALALGIYGGLRKSPQPLRNGSPQPGRTLFVFDSLAGYGDTLRIWPLLAPAERRFLGSVSLAQNLDSRLDYEKKSYTWDLPSKSMP
jgi:hypothetical protein